MVSTSIAVRSAALIQCMDRIAHRQPVAASHLRSLPLHCTIYATFLCVYATLRRYATAAYLPQISYLTLIDKFVLLSMCMIVLATLLHALVGVLQNWADVPMDTLDKLNKVCFGVTCLFWLGTQLWFLRAAHVARKSDTDAGQGRYHITMDHADNADLQDNLQEISFTHITTSTDESSWLRRLNNRRKALQISSPTGRISPVLRSFGSSLARASNKTRVGEPSQACSSESPPPSPGRMRSRKASFTRHQRPVSPKARDDQA